MDDVFCSLKTIPTPVGMDDTGNSQFSQRIFRSFACQKTNCFKAKKLFGYCPPPVVHAFQGNSVHMGRKCKLVNTKVFPTKFRSPWSSERATLWTHPTECDFRPRSTAYIQTPRCCKPCTRLNTGPAASDLLDPVDAPHCHNTQTPWTKTAKGFHHYVDRRSASSST